MADNSGVDRVGLDTQPDQHIDADGGRDDMPTLPKRTTSPAFQFYPKDFLSSASVQQMSMTERGIYITLLAHCWLEGRLPSDPKALARIVGMKPSQFERVWAGPLSGRFQIRGADLVNPRLEEERRKQLEYRRRQSDNGKKGGRPSGLSDGKGLGLATQSTRDRRQEISSSFKEEKKGVPAFDGQASFRRLCAAYPGNRVNDSQRVSSLFLDVLGTSPEEWHANYALMLANLETHKQSHEWAVKGFVPNLEKWLESGRWKRPMDVAPAAAKPDPFARLRERMKATGTEGGR